MIKSGLAALKSSITDSAPKGTGVRYLKVDPGKSVRLRFMSEIDASSEFASPERGQAIIVAEHSSPSDFRKTALCTADEGNCYGCEQAAKETYVQGKPSWRAKRRLYANVVVDDGSDEYVAVFRTGAGARATTALQLLDYAVENGGISDITWKYSRQGEGITSSYTLTPGRQAVSDWNGFTPFDLENQVVRHIAYPDQQGYYEGTDQDW